MSQNPYFVTSGAWGFATNNELTEIRKQLENTVGKHEFNAFKKEISKMIESVQVRKPIPSPPHPNPPPKGPEIPRTVAESPRNPSPLLLNRDKQPQLPQSKNPYITPPIPLPPAIPTPQMLHKSSMRVQEEQRQRNTPADKHAERAKAGPQGGVQNFKDEAGKAPGSGRGGSSVLTPSEEIALNWKMYNSPFKPKKNPAGGDGEGQSKPSESQLLANDLENMVGLNSAQKKHEQNNESSDWSSDDDSDHSTDEDVTGEDVTPQAPVKGVNFLVGNQIKNRRRNILGKRTKKKVKQPSP
jgi:hypothetical protein